MGKITIELLRKRSEHNEGEIHSLEELALHQEKLDRIELIDKACRNVKILLLQNNVISKIENVQRLKNLEYLNLALNIVERIENLEGCESLKKLDLTLNFVAELTSVKSLKNLPNLEQLYLTGNPCCDFNGYREYVIGVLSQLKSLDGREITHSERICASQDLNRLEKLILDQQCKYIAEHKKSDTENKLIVENDGEQENSLEHGDDDDDSDFWNRKSADTPEIRKEMSRRLELQDAKKKPKDVKKVKVLRKLTSADGKPLNINEAKVDFFLNDAWEENQLILDLAVPKHMCTTLIDVDVQPFYVTVKMKGKIFQLVLPDEVKPDSSTAQRSQTTGHLLVTMPKIHEKCIQSWKSKEAPIDLTKKSGSSGDFATKSSLPGVPSTKSNDKGTYPFNFANDEVPPLI